MADASTSLRRSARQPKPVQRETSPVAEAKAKPAVKRKAKAEPGSAEQLVSLLHKSNSQLTQIDLSELINANVWNMLSSDSQERLAALLPPTAFSSYTSTLESDHPATSAPSPHVNHCKPELLDPAVFNDPHFLAAARTFQDHLFSNWFSDAHNEKLKKHVEGTRDGTLAAPWKDEVWEREHEHEGMPAPMDLAGDAAEIKLSDLVKNRILQRGDILAYKRKFTAVGVTVEKDAIIQTIDPRTHTLTVLVEHGLLRDLPESMLQVGTIEPSATARSMTISSPSQLENGLLDVEGRVERTKRPHGNAWKAVTVWRWPEDDRVYTPHALRGGRVEQGTLFYLRACLYQDR